MNLYLSFRDISDSSTKSFEGGIGFQKMELQTNNFSCIGCIREGINKTTSIGSKLKFKVN